MDPAPKRFNSDRESEAFLPFFFPSKAKQSAKNNPSF
jgi:hypothetical protein